MRNHMMGLLLSVLCVPTLYGEEQPTEIPTPRVISYTVTVCKDPDMDDAAWQEYVHETVRIQKSVDVHAQLDGLARVIRHTKSAQQKPLVELEVRTAEGTCRCKCCDDGKCTCAPQFKGVCPCEVR